MEKEGFLFEREGGSASESCEPRQDSLLLSFLLVSSVDSAEIANDGVQAEDGGRGRQKKSSL